MAAAKQFLTAVTPIAVSGEEVMRQLLPAVTPSAVSGESRVVLFLLPRVLRALLVTCATLWVLVVAFSYAPSAVTCGTSSLSSSTLTKSDPLRRRSSSPGSSSLASRCTCSSLAGFGDPLRCRGSFSLGEHIFTGVGNVRSLAGSRC